MTRRWLRSTALSKLRRAARSEAASSVVACGSGRPQGTNCVYLDRQYSRSSASCGSYPRQRCGTWQNGNRTARTRNGHLREISHTPALYHCLCHHNAWRPRSHFDPPRNPCIARLATRRMAKINQIADELIAGPPAPPQISQLPAEDQARQDGAEPRTPHQAVDVSRRHLSGPDDQQ